MSLLPYLLIKSFTYVDLDCYFLNLKHFLPPNLQVGLIFRKHVYPEDSYTPWHAACEAQTEPKPH